MPSRDSTVAIHWFRDDLRLTDNPALHRAATQPGGLIALVIDEQVDDPTVRPLGAAATWWREQSLHHLAAALSTQGVTLLRLVGDPRRIVPAVVTATGASCITWSRRYNPPQLALDTEIATTLRSRGVLVHSCRGHLLTEPAEVKTTTGSSYRVFTPFAKATKAHLDLPALSPAPPLHGAIIKPKSLSTLPWSAPSTEPDWAKNTLAHHCIPGEMAAQAALFEFTHRAENYAESRDFPGITATSALSAHLRFGELSVARAWTTVDDERFRTQLLWRDFAWHRLFHRGQLHVSPIDERFNHFPYRDDPVDLIAWQRGETGIPIVDAGMRELWQTGRMHNRVRMLVGSLLTKNLGIDWRAGEAWFWDTLVDADPAINPFSWQWVAGCGDDAAPYFRIFNPQLQARKFDAAGRYTRRWLPNSSPGEPIVDLASTRQWALDAYRALPA